MTLMLDPINLMACALAWQVASGVVGLLRVMAIDTFERWLESLR